MVLISSPTIDSTPGRSAGRPETVSPKTTSSLPVNSPSTTAQANWTTVATVTSPARAKAVSSAVASAGKPNSAVANHAASPVSWAPGATSVGPATPASACCHACTPAALSRSTNQRR